LAVTTPFTADLGTSQGRIRPANWIPLNGEYVMCLGHDEPGHVVDLDKEDFVELEQSYDATGYSILQFALHLRAPVIMPPGVEWTIIISTNVSDYYEIMIPVGARERTLVDMTVPTVVNPATSSIKIKLALLGPLGVHTVELPAVYVDNVLSMNPDQNPYVASRDPKPDDTNVNADTQIRFNVYGISDALTTVIARVNGVTVASWNGANAATLASVAVGWSAAGGDADGATTRYAIIPPGFASEEIVTVEVEASTAINTTTTTWSFTIADTAGPRVLSASARAVFEVAVQWNEPIADASLDPAFFVLSLDSDPPAHVPNVQDVQRDADRPEWIVLTIDQPATPGATYLVTASASVTDVLGNAVEAQYASATFDAYLSPLTPANRLLSLYQELPAAERDTDQFQELKLFCDVLDEGLRALAIVADDWALIAADPDTAVESWLDAILWEIGNPFDWLPMSIRTKRLLARWMHQLVALKGSGLGIRAAIRLLLGIEVQVHVYGVGLAVLGETIIGETFILGSDDEDDLYTFWVIVQEQLDAETRSYMNRIIDIMKVAHERHLIVEPVELFVPDHWTLGFSQLGVETELHA
jgi:phage tail-like protein